MANRKLDMRSVHHALDLARDEKMEALIDASHYACQEVDCDNDLDPRELTELGRRQIKQEEEEMADRGSWYDNYSDYAYY